MTAHCPPPTAHYSAERAAAIRHAVYADLIDRLPVASYDQACRFIANLKIVNRKSSTVMSEEFVRRMNAALMLFIGLRVTPDIGETNTNFGGTLREIERYLNAKYGERLAVVPGFVGGQQAVGSAYDHCPRPTAYRLLLPKAAVVHAYRTPSRHYAGILLQPLAELNRFFLLSSARYGGPKATPLCPADRQFFTQYEEVAA